jgi:hypothetical protein
VSKILHPASSRAYLTLGPFFVSSALFFSFALTFAFPADFDEADFFGSVLKSSSSGVEALDPLVLRRAVLGGIYIYV